MSQVILCRVGDKPHVTSLAADPDGGHLSVLQGTLGGLVVSLALYDGVNLWCSRDGLVFGLTLTRRVLARSLIQFDPSEITLQVDDLKAGFGLEEWHAKGDFVLARSGADGRLTDLTESDIQHWMYWLGLDYPAHS